RCKSCKDGTQQQVGFHEFGKSRSVVYETGSSQSRAPATPQPLSAQAKGFHTTYISTYSLTGIASSRSGSSDTERIRCCCSSEKRLRRLVLNFSTSSGIPSLRRRLCPIGYSTVSSSTVPSFNSTRSEFAIDLFSG